MKRSTNFVEFARLLEKKIQSFAGDVGHGFRIAQINSPEAYGDIEVILQDTETGITDRAFTYRADGSFSGLSFWQEGQI